MTELPPDQSASEETPREWLTDLLGRSPETEYLIRHVERLEAEIERLKDARRACQQHHLPMIERCGERIGELEAELAQRAALDQERR